MKHSDLLALRRVPVHSRTLPIRAGTRGSRLALVQTRAFLAHLARVCPGLDRPGVFAECVIGVTGDAVQDKPLADIGGKGLFAKEIHDALLAGRIDLAVHSLKDLDTVLPPGVALACMLPREDARDSLVLGAALAVDEADPYAALPLGAVVGTCSVRRQAQLLAVRPDLRITMMRGNVQTRLGKLAAGTCDATLLALAGLHRLGLDQVRAVHLNPEEMVPAAGQGIVAVTVRADDAELLELLGQVSDADATAAALAERSLLAVLDGSCHTPIGAHARILPDGQLRLTGLVARPDGSWLRRRTLAGAAGDAARLGTELGHALRADCPADLLAELFGESSRSFAAACGGHAMAAGD